MSHPALLGLKLLHSVGGLHLLAILAAAVIVVKALRECVGLYRDVLAAIRETRETFPRTTRSEATRSGRGSRDHRDPRGRAPSARLPESADGGRS